MSHPYDHIPLIVLSGVGRSGTCAVRDALGRHSRIHSTGTENNILYDLLDTARRNCTIESRRAAMRVDQATYDGLFRDLVLDLLWPEPMTRPPERLLAFSNLRPDRAEHLCRLFSPEAGAAPVKIVYLVRNGIEAVSSRLRYESFADLPFHEHCEAWSRSVELAEWGRGRDDVMVLRHENLLAADALAESLDALWSFIDLPAEPRCFDTLLYVCHHPTRDDDGEDMGTPPGEVLSGRADRCRDWTGTQRRTFADLCGEAMRYWGYEMPWLNAADLSRTTGAP
ncbi:MAG: sulfotransferase [Planctomycetota bacterium]|jgi:hypothetical protein